MRPNTRRAFSMLELTLVIAIMGILIAAASIAILPKLLRGQKTVTKNTMRVVQQGLTDYKIDNNVYPATLTQLVPDYVDKAPKDAWQREFQYQIRAAGAGVPYDLISAGDDVQFGTIDDINVWALDDET